MARKTIIALAAMTVVLAATSAHSGRRGNPAPGVGLEPSEIISHGGALSGVGGAQEGAGVLRQGDVVSRDMGFQFNGFLRIPFRVGIGTGQNMEGDGDDGLKLHSPPQIPDGSYLNWMFTNNMCGPWTEMVLSYGNSTVAAHVGVSTYDLTEGSYPNLAAQLGISTSFVSLNFPTLFGRLGGIVANVGVFENRYGAAHQYSADKYDTYLFGSTHVAGENVRAFFDVTRNLTLHIEQGFGGKLMLPPFTDSDDPNAVELAYLPYGGDVQQGTTLLHHEHLGISWHDKLTLAAHLIMSWNPDSTQISESDPPEKDGQIINVGLDLKWIEFFFGEGYLGYSHVVTKDLARLGGAIDFLHVRDGWNILDNYFKPVTYDETVPAGNGTIDSILFQYIFSLARFMWHPKEFWGQDRDLMISVFGMWNRVVCDKGEDPACGDNWEYADQDANIRLKYGADMIYTPVSWLGVGGRFDSVNIDMNDSSKSFQVASGMLLFKSDFVSHEQILLQYSHYFYGDNVAAGWPYEDEPYGPATYDGEPALKPDNDVVKVSAIMWW